MGNQNKTTGEIAEMLFTARAMQEGLNVLEPVSDNVTYDRVVECAGKFFRVQVKSSQFKEEGRTCWNFRVWKGGAKEAYVVEDFDYLAAYVMPEDTWYLLPVGIVKKCLCLGGEHYKEYKNNWEVFK